MNKNIHFFLILIAFSVFLIAAVPTPVNEDVDPDKYPHSAYNVAQTTSHFTNKIINFNPNKLVLETPIRRVNMAEAAKVQTTPRNEIKSGYFKPCDSCSLKYRWAIVEVQFPGQGLCRWTYTYDD